MRRIYERLWWWWRGERELDEEIRTHLAIETERLMALDLSEAEARDAARRTFGRVDIAREDSRAVWSFLSLETWLSDLRYGVRAALRHPGFTFVAAVSLALGIATNAALFRVVDAVALRRLAVPRAAEVLLVEWTSGATNPWWDRYRNGLSPDGGAIRGAVFSTEAFEHLRRSRRTVASLAAFAEISSLRIRSNDGVAFGSGQYVSGSYWRTLGLEAAVGRLSDESDARQTAEPVVVLGYRYWQRQFGGSPAVLGTRLSLNDLACTIVGVAPRGFDGMVQVGDVPDVFVPIGVQPRLQFDAQAGREGGSQWLTDPRSAWLRVLARRRAASDAATVRAELGQALDNYVKSAPPPADRRDLPVLGVVDGSRGLTERRAAFVPMLWSLAGLSAIVFLVACANVAGLLMARGAARTREIAMRFALGAGRCRVVRQLVTESVVVAAAGAVLGLVASLGLRRMFLAVLGDPARPFVLDVGVDLRMAGFTAAASLLACAAFSLGPALRASRGAETARLKQGSRSVAAGRTLLGRSLVAAQIALAVPLLFDAGLLVRTVANLQYQALGFDAESVLTFRVTANIEGYDDARRQAVFAGVLERLEKLPGVRAAAYSERALVGERASIQRMSVPGAPTPARAAAAEGLPSFIGGDAGWVRPVGGRFFEAMRIPLLSGRAFDERDSAAGRPVAVVNETFARSFLGRANPIGREIRMSGHPPVTLEIVGLVKDARTDSLRTAIPPTVFRPVAQDPEVETAAFVVRAAADPLALAPAVRRIVAEVDPSVPISQMQTQADRIAVAASRERAYARAAALFGLLALVLACIGLYGTLSHAVARRTSEIGIRMALGADRGRVIRTVLRDALVLVGVGLLVGSVLALASGRLVATQVFGLAAVDPLTLAGAIGLLAAVALLAASIPARRASLVDPLTALRHD